MDGNFETETRKKFNLNVSKKVINSTTENDSFDEFYLEPRHGHNLFIKIFLINYQKNPLSSLFCDE